MATGDRSCRSGGSGCGRGHRRRSSSCAQSRRYGGKSERRSGCVICACKECSARPVHAQVSRCCPRRLTARCYFSWQSTSTLLVTPLVTVTGPEALQSAAPPSNFGLCPETVYVPTDTGTENRPFAPTSISALAPFDSRRKTSPLRARGPAPGRPPTAWSVPVRVPVGPGGPLGDEQLANDTETATTGSRQSKVGELRRTAYPPSRVVGLLVRSPGSLCGSRRAMLDQPDGHRDEQC